jgi:peptidoglycan/xylan/chitin deacetylase (PgdA/CDA1 family)
MCWRRCSLEKLEGIVNSRSFYKRLLASAAVYPMLWRLADARLGVTVLTYHALARDDEEFNSWVVAGLGDFGRQLQFLQENYAIVSLDEAAQSLAVNYSGKPRLVITFDDGHSCLFDHLLPVVERLNLPVTLYISTGHIEEQRCYWFDRLANALQVASPIVVDLRPHGIGTWRAGFASGASAWSTIGPLFEALKQVPPQVREIAVDDAVAQLASATPRDVEPLQPLSRDQLGALGRSRWISIGAHSHCHSLLDQLPGPEAEASMRMSRDLLRAWTRQPVSHFAYPNGNFTPELEAAAARVGFLTAATTQPGIWTKADRPFAVPRLGIGRFDGLHGLKLMLARAKAVRSALDRPDRQVHSLKG